MVAMDYVILTDCGAQKDSLRDVLCGLNQQGWNPGYDPGFCDLLSLDLGNDTTVLADSCVQLSGPEGDYSYQWSTGDTTRVLTVPYNVHLAGTRRYSVVGIINQCTSTGSVYLTFIDPSAISEHSPSGVKVFPNPFTDNINLSMQELTKPVKVWVFDIYGKIIFSKTIEIARPHHTEFIQLHNFPRGVYFLKWQSGSKTGAIKILKQK